MLEHIYEGIKGFELPRGPPSSKYIGISLLLMMEASDIKHGHFIRHLSVLLVLVLHV